MPSNHLILCCPLLVLYWICPSIRVFSSESALHIRWPKSVYYCRQMLYRLSHQGSLSIRTSASASVLPMNIQGWFPLGLTGLISFAVKGTLKSLLQHHSLKASILQCSAFSMVQLSYLYMTIQGVAKSRTRLSNWNELTDGFSSSHVHMWELDYKEW